MRLHALSRRAVRSACGASLRGRSLVTASEAYRNLVASDELRYDEAQAQLVEQLSKTQRRVDADPWAALPSYPPPPPAGAAARAATDEGGDGASENAAAAPSSGGATKDPAAPAEATPPLPPPPRIPRGLYIWGDVGTGKSRCMDLFFDCAAVEKKQRVHFHRFMLTVHERIAEHKATAEEGATSERDALTAVAHAIAAECQLLCFDEFQVQDIADAMIMQKLFTILWGRGTVVVATSNRPPSDLYLDGLHRQYFIPFIGTLEQFCKVHHLPIATDYRLEGADAATHARALRIATLDERSDCDAVAAIFGDVSGAAAAGDASPGHGPTVVQTRTGRAVPVPRARGDACWFTFDEICATDTGAADFQAICDRYSTVVLSGVPHLSAADHNEARRFITLIDELYEHGARLVLSAAAAPEMLFVREAEVVAPLATDAVAASLPHAHAHTWTPADVRRGDDLASAPPPLAMVDDDEEMPEGDPAAETTGVSLAELSSVKELDFAFRRCASRIAEMTSEGWWRRRA
jgi:cell division protein ZapE